MKTSTAISSIVTAFLFVTGGVYKPDQGAGQVPGDREATFQLPDGVTLEGGYAGCDEPDPEERDIALLETILSDDLAGNDGKSVVKRANPNTNGNPLRLRNSVMSGNTAWTAARTAVGFNGTLEQARRDLIAVARRAPGRRQAQNLAKRFRLHGESYFRFITTPGIEPTNNLGFVKK